MPRNDANRRYRESHDEFSQLVGYGIDLIEAQAGEPVSDDCLFWSERILSKMLVHGVSLLRLSPSSTPSAAPEIWDISSSYAVGRALVETYEALAYIALDQVSNAERSFRVLLWTLHAEERRLNMLKLIGSTDSSIPRLQEHYASLRDQLLSHEFLTQELDELRRKVQRGETPPYHLSRKERDRRQDVDHDYHNAVIMHLSSHVHTHPFSVQQLSTFRAGEPECRRLMSIPIQYATVFLAKALGGARLLFSKQVEHPPNCLDFALDKWSEVLRLGLKSAG